MNPRLQELENQMAKLSGQMAPLAARYRQGTLEADDQKDYDEKMADFLRIRQIHRTEKEADEQAGAVLQADQDFNQPNGKQRVSGLITRQGAEQNGKKPRTTGNVGLDFVRSDAFKEFRQSPSMKASARMKIGAGSIYDRSDAWQGIDPEYDANAELEERALIYTGATANLVTPGRQPGIYRPELMPFQVRMRDVLINGATDSNSVQYVREGTFTNAAVETAEAVSTATGLKPESAITFTVVSDNVATIAHLVPVTRQTIDDVPAMQTYINTRLIDGLKLREDAELLAGDGTGANIQGLMSRTGIGNLDAAYWTANPLPTAGAAANKLDRIRRGRKYVAVTGLAQANFVVLHPDDLEQFDELKDTTGKYVVGDPINYNGVQRLWGLTVVESTAITANNFLIGDGRMAAIFDKMDATIFFADQHSDWFARNIFALMAEERLALAVFRPSAFAKGVLS